ncbi:MAG: PD40 domain-containing protein [Acidobacteria bacterium]|nr:PD40 domain-containing protein [Acidobacteriota bacterium]
MRQQSTARFYRFADYELDSAKRLLLRRGERIKLTPKAFDVLAVLVQHYGATVSKEGLFQAVWPGTTVEEISLTRNISVLRKMLGEKPDDHSYIVTMPGTGYQFVAPVECADEVDEVQARPGASVARYWPVVVPALLAVTGLALWLSWPQPSAVWRISPLTTYPGLERSPALSPDGNHVAFTWDGEKQDNTDIYIKPLHSEPLRRLTSDPAEEISPVWSPDGRTIAFFRRLKDDRMEVVLIPAEGGAERRLAQTNATFMAGPSLAWSPDGLWLAIPDRNPGDKTPGLFLLSAVSRGATPERRKLSSAESPYDDQSLAFSPDGRTLAFSRVCSGAVREIYVLPLSRDNRATGPARRLTHDGGLAESPVWSRDGKRILYVFSAAVGDAPREIRIIGVSGGGSAERVPLPEDGISGLSLGRHLVYARSTEDTNIWRAEIPRGGTASGAVQRLIASTRRDSEARYSTDGRKIAFGSNRSGSSEIWVAEADGSNPVQLTSIGGPYVGVINWSPDGRWLVFLSHMEGHADVYRIPVSGGTAQRLTTDPADDGSPRYSWDGQWIYFSSWRSGQSEIWKMPAEGGRAVQITHVGGAYMQVESPDRKTIYYCHINSEKGVWRVPVESGKAEHVAGPLRPGLCGLDVTREGIYYTGAPDSNGRHSIRFHSLRTGDTRTIVSSDRRLASISVSPDERFVIFSQSDQSGSDLMLIENFVPR